MTLKDLQAEYKIYLREKHPNVPAHALPHKVFEDRTANGLTNAIKTFCDIRGVLCDRRGNEGRFRPGATVIDVIGRARVMKGKYLPGQNNGQSDLEITLKGKRHCVEVKIGRDTQSDAQKEFEAKVKRAGGVYVIVRDWAQFYENFNRWKK